MDADQRLERLENCFLELLNLLVAEEVGARPGQVKMAVSRLRQELRPSFDDKVPAQELR